MNYKKIALALIAASTVSLAQEKCTTSACSNCESSAPTAEVAKNDQVLVTVNGTEIKQSTIQKVVQDQMSRMMQSGQNIPQAQIGQMLKGITEEATNMLIDMALLDQEVAKSGLTINKAEVKAFILGQINEMIKGSGMDLAGYEKVLKERTGKTLEEILESESTRPEAKQSILHTKFIESKSAKDLEVSEKEVKAFYTSNESRFSKPAQVKASHILVKTSKDATDAEKAAAKAELVALQIQLKDGADFATVAKENSACPSSAQGGDLGFFGKGQMVPEFEAVTFAMKVGEVSDIVTTQFGFHLIKKTDETKAEVTAFEKVKESIKAQLKMQKVFKAQQVLVAELKKTAKIEHTQPVLPKEVSAPEADALKGLLGK